MLAKQIKAQWEQLKHGYSAEEQQKAIDELAGFFLDLGEEEEFADEDLDDDCPLFG